MKNKDAILEPQETLLVVISGHVQSVGFRAATIREAHRLGVTGWVRNLDNGTVEALVQGSPDHVDRMLEWMRHGPPAAEVRDIHTEIYPGERRFERFEMN